MTSQSTAPHSIAVVVATYQGERYLAEQLESLRAQTVRPTSVIISDVGSTDRTLAIAEEFAGQAPFPVLIRRHTGSRDDGDNLLSAALLATTDLVALCGQADVWLPTKIAETMRAFARAEVALSTHTAILIDPRRRVRGRFTQGITENRLLSPLTLDPWGSFAGFTMTFRRDLLDLIASERRGDDPECPARSLTAERWVYFLASCFGEAALIAQPLALHRSDVGAPVRTDGLRGLYLRVRTVVVRQRSLSTRSSRRHAIAVARSRLLLEASDNPRLGRAQGVQLRAAARHWTQAARCEENRLAFYREATVEERFDKLLRNVADGTYRRVTDGAWRPTQIAQDLLSLLVPP